MLCHTHTSIFIAKKDSSDNVASTKSAIKHQLIEEVAAMAWYFTTLYHIAGCSVAPDSTHIGVGHVCFTLGKLEKSKHGVKHLTTLQEIRCVRSGYCG